MNQRMTYSIRGLFTRVRGSRILRRSPFAGSWIRPRNTSARSPKATLGLTLLFWLIIPDGGETFFWGTWSYRGGAMLPLSLGACGPSP
jgi:hypothetical protein